MLSQLEDIALGDNNLNGTIPTELASITKLKEINLGSNFLTGPIPFEFGKLIELESLVLGKHLCATFVFISLLMCCVFAMYTS